MSKIFVTAAALALFAGSPALAVDIQNRDDVEYTAKVLEYGETVEQPLAALGKEESVCESKCTITVEGVGTIEAEGNEVVVIEGRKLSKQAM